MSRALDNPSEIERAMRDIRNFTEVVTVALNRPDPELQVLPLEISNLPQVASSPEFTEILREMRRLSSAAVDVMARPMPDVSAAQYHPAPVVHVAAPAVQISPNITVEKPNTRFRVTVESRDNTAQQRIKTLIIEPIE